MRGGRDALLGQLHQGERAHALLDVAGARVRDTSLDVASRPDPCPFSSFSHFPPCIGTRAVSLPPLPLLQACDCPDGRAGITCGGCNADAGCGAGEECRRSFSLGRGGNISCEIEEMVPDYMKLMTQWYNASGTRVEFGVSSSGGCPWRWPGPVW